jgi:HK97 family phage portal protein
MTNFDEVVAEVLRSNRESANGVSVTPEGSLRMGAVFAAVSLLADTIGSLPLILYERQEKSRRRATEHYLYPILHDAPNPMMTAVEYRSTLQAYLVMRGNAISQIEFDETGKITELWPLRWENVQEVKADKGSGIIYYYYMLPDGKMQWLDSARIWHLRGWGSDGIVGYAPITLARRAVELGISAEEFGVRFFQNDARPGIVLEHPSQLSKQAHENLKGAFNEEHQGVRKSHRIAILEEGLKLHEIGIPPEDAQFLQTRKYSVTEIARFFRVPPHMIGDLERATFTNIEHQGIEFVTYSLQSWMTRWEQSIKQNLLPESDRQEYYAEHLVDSLLRGDTTSRYAAYQSGIQAGWFTRADAREKENLEPIEGLEKPLVPMNMMTVGEEEEQNLEPRRHGEHGEEQSFEPRRYGEHGEEQGVNVEGESRANRAARSRHRLMNSYRRIFEDSAKRILRREVNDVMAAGQKYLREGEGRGERRSLSAFEAWLRQFYEGHKDFIFKQMKPVYDSYSDLVSDAAEAEVGKTVDRKGKESFVNSYLASYAGRHAGTSENKIGKALAGTEDALKALEEELDGWVDERGSQIADEESVRSNNAVAVMAYEMMGVQLLRSMAFGESCPYCNDLDGQVIGIDSYFIKAGESFQPEGADKPLTSVDNLRHAPYHGGCDCMTVSA